MTQPAIVPANALTTLTEEYDALVSEFATDTTSELQQATSLIRDAINDIDHSFRAIGARHGDGDIQDGVATAVRALQFEDLVRQILEHVISRMDQLSRLTTELADQAAHDREGDCMAQLARLRERLAADRLNLRADRHRAVTQSSMDEGDIELF